MIGFWRWLWRERVVGMLSGVCLFGLLVGVVFGIPIFSFWVGSGFKEPFDTWADLRSSPMMGESEQFVGRTFGTMFAIIFGGGALWGLACSWKEYRAEVHGEVRYP